MSSPLGTYSATFDSEGEVPELNARLLVPRKPGEVLGMGAVDQHSYSPAVHVVYFRDGRRLYFDKAGHVTFWRRGPDSVRYHWANGLLSSMEVLVDGVSSGSLEIDRDAQGRIAQVRDHRGLSAIYSYDDAGHLARVTAGRSQREYKYSGAFVSEIWQDGKRLRSLAYDNQGHLIRDEGVGPALTYDVRRTSAGTEVRAIAGNQEHEIGKFDRLQRPTFRRAPDGTTFTWDWDAQGSVTTRVVTPGRNPLQVDVSADRRSYRVRTAEGDSYSAVLDSAGRPVSLQVGETPAMRTRWHPDGQTAFLSTANSSLTANYDTNGSMDEVLVHESTEQSSVRTWQRIKFAAGRPVVVEDFSGARTQFSYAPSGEITRIVGADSEIRVTNSANLERLETSWGETLELHYDPKSRAITRYEASAAGARSSVEYKDGQPTSIRDLSGTLTQFEYVDSGPAKGKPRAVRLPSGASIRYGYDKQGRLTEIDCAQVYRLRYEYDELDRVVRIVQVRAPK